MDDIQLYTVMDPIATMTIRESFYVILLPEGNFASGFEVATKRVNLIAQLRRPSCFGINHWLGGLVGGQSCFRVHLR